MARSLVILGGNALHRGFALKKETYGVDEIIVVDWNKEPAYKGDRHIQCDIKDYEKIYNSDIKWNEVLCVYTSADAAVISQKELHKRMGLFTPDDQAIENALIKGRSTECWSKAGILGKRSYVLEDYRQFEDYGAEKYIFKPNCSSGSRNITILSRQELSRENLHTAWELAAEGSMDGKVIAEEFCEGTEYTVDMLGDDRGNVGVYGISKKYHTPYNDKNKIAVKLHYCPQDVADETLQRIAAFGQQCYKAVGLKNSFGHLEIIQCEDGRIVPVEIGGRSSGYIASHLIDAINQECFINAYAKVLRGGRVKDGIVFDKNKSSMYFFYDIKPGISRKTTNLMNYLDEKIVSLAHDRTKLVKGKEFQMLQADHERYGLEILCGSRQDLTIEKVIKAEKEFNRDFMGEK